MMCHTTWDDHTFFCLTDKDKIKPICKMDGHTECFSFTLDGALAEKTLRLTVTPRMLSKAILIIQKEFYITMTTI